MRSEKQPYRALYFESVPNIKTDIALKETSLAFYSCQTLFGYNVGEPCTKKKRFL